MKRKIFFIVIFLSFSLSTVALVLSQNHHPKKQNRVCFENHCFDIELAITLEERNTGLMFREKLDPKNGMLFVFDEEEKHPFWMKNTLIPLDIVWINENKEIVFISENIPPCKKSSCPTIEPTKKAKYVLEINEGISKKIGLIVGDKVKIEYIKN